MVILHSIASGKGCIPFLFIKIISAYSSGCTKINILVSLIHTSNKSHNRITDPIIWFKFYSLFRYLLGISGSYTNKIKTNNYKKYFFQNSRVLSHNKSDLSRYKIPLPVKYFQWVFYARVKNPSGRK